jgi:integrase
MAVNRASLVQVQAWMGHSHIQTTARYLHAKSQATDAALLAEAFASRAPVHA